MIRISNTLMVRLAMPLGLLLGLIAAPGTAPAQVSELYVRGQVEGLARSGSQLFWKAGCGDDFSPELSYVRSAGITANAGGGVLPRTGRTLFQPGRCGPDRVVSRNLAVDDRYVYWITAGRRLVRVPRDSDLATPESLLTVPPANDSGYHLAVSRGWVVWSDGTAVHRAPVAAPYAIQTLLRPGALPGAVRGVAPRADGYVVLVGNTLHALVPFMLDQRNFVAFPLNGGAGATAFAVSGDRVYVASTRSDGGYRILAVPLSGHAQTIHMSPPGRPEDRVYHLAVQGGTVYWHVAGRGGGPLMQVPAAGGAAQRLTDDFRMAADSPLTASPDSLFWANNDGLFRLPLGGPAGAEPYGDVWITGIEWVQVVQTPDNEVPLISGKPTAIRVYVRSREDGSGPWTNVRAQLQVEGSPRQHVLGPIAVSQAGGDRRRLDSSFLFRLTPEETLPGQRRITVTLTAGDFRTESDVANNRRDFTITFAPRIELYLHVFRWVSTNNAMCPPGSHPPPADDTITSAADVERDRRLAENILPVSSLYTYPLEASGMRFDNRNCEAYLQAYQFLKDEMDRRFAGAPLLAVSITPPSDPAHEHGWCCEQSWRGHWIMRINNPGRSSYTLAHELIHQYYSRSHPWDDGSGYPTTRRPASGIAAAPIGDVVGIDFSGAQPTLVLGQDSDGRSLRNDLMSYARPDWISLFTYCRMLRGLSEGRTVCPASVEGGGR